MPIINTKDGTEIYYKDWGRGPVVTFAHPTGLGRAAQKPAWLLERTGFELPSPVDLALMHPQH